MLLPLLTSALLFLSQQGGPAPAAAPAATPVAGKPYKLDNPVDELRLVDLDGKEHALFAESEGKAVVLVFWSYRDPVSRFYAPQLTALRDARAGRLAVYLVNSNADEIAGSGDPLARVREVAKAEGLTLPLLIDKENRIADDFAAIANGQAFLIDASRYLRYVGGIDDDPKGDRRKKGIALQAWLQTAVDAALEGKPVTDNWRRPAGRPIKRPTKVAPAAAPAPGGDPGKKE